MDFLQKLRPTATTAAAIGASLERAELAHVEADAAVIEAKQRRDSLLLDGQPAQLAAAEKALTAAREAVERVEAVKEQLVTRHSTALRAEKITSVTEARADLVEAYENLDAWWAKNGPVLRTMILEGQELKRVGSDCFDGWDERRRSAAQDYPDAEFEQGPPGSSPAHEWPEKVKSLIEWGTDWQNPPGDSRA